MKKRSKLQKEKERIKHANTYREAFEHGYQIGFERGRNYENRKTRPTTTEVRQSH